MKILVIGGTQFFGKHLVRNLIEAKHDVHIFTRGLKPDPFEDKVIRHQGDRKVLADLKNVSLQHRFDVIFDQMGMTAEEAEITLDAFGQNPHYVFTSTLSVYDNGAEIKETDFDPLNYNPKVPTTPSEVYMQGKRAAEKVYLSAHSISIMRIPIVVGIDDYTLRLKIQIERVAQGKPTYITNPQGRFSLVKAADAARALQWMMDEKRQGIFNIASPGAITAEEFFKLAEEVVERKATFAESLSDETRPLILRAEDWFMDVSKAINAGFKIEPLMQWLPTLMRELHKQN